MGLAYPGGPEIERRARGGDPARFDLPRGMINSDDANFSFSGLKTAVRYLLPKLQRAPGSLDCARDDMDLCASFQRAVVDVLVAKTIAAARMAGRKLITVSGGVSCNGELRRQMSLGCRARRVGVALRRSDSLHGQRGHDRLSLRKLRLERGEFTPLTTEINPNLALA